MRRSAIAQYSGGPSPRARGSRRRQPGARARSRSIPAGAGKPRRSPRKAAPCRVHPRGRGEAPQPTDLGRRGAGPSPRARGSHDAAEEGEESGGSIPAGAGKPRSRTGPAPPSRVHPRGRGEALQQKEQEFRRQGPSPRARGSRLRAAPLVAGLGSIPAGAGKPAYRATGGCSRGVHPRGRGEARRAPAVEFAQAGPSPRARGSLDHLAERDGRAGSIPAGAGKPQSLPGRRPFRAVHPRGRGEAGYFFSPAPALPGPSPRARGSRPPDRRDQPRRGPSPRARGSHGRGRDDLPGRGSIPAGAGKPRPSCPRG